MSQTPTPQPSAPAGRLICEYADCPEYVFHGADIIGDPETDQRQVTCPECRRYMGLSPLAVEPPDAGVIPPDGCDGDGFTDPREEDDAARAAAQEGR